MDKALMLFIFLFFICRSDHQPRHFAMQKEYEQVASTQELFNFHNADTLIEHQLSLLSDADSAPLLYFSDIKTPVCIDGLCKPMYIKVYWNLLGAYVGFGTVKSQLLTKFDHEEFEPEDYLMLHQLLLNDKSILRRKKMSELYDKRRIPQKQIKYKGVELDAVSGATIKEISSSVVEGALYSCYTLWHLVHGEVKGKMKSYLDSIYSPSLQAYFLNSDYPDYHLYALKKMDGAEFPNHVSRILSIFEQGKPLTRTYILKKMPEMLWSDPLITRSLFGNFSTLDINSKTLLVKNLPWADTSAAEQLAAQLPDMSKNQLKLYLTHLTQNPELKTPELVEKLTAIAKKRDFVYAYLVQKFLAF